VTASGAVWLDPQIDAPKAGPELLKNDLRVGLPSRCESLQDANKKAASTNAGGLRLIFP